MFMCTVGDAVMYHRVKVLFFEGTIITTNTLLKVFVLYLLNFFFLFVYYLYIYKFPHLSILFFSTLTQYDGTSVTSSLYFDDMYMDSFLFFFHTRTRHFKRYTNPFIYVCVRFSVLSGRGFLF